MRMHNAGYQSKTHNFVETARAKTSTLVNGATTLPAISFTVGLAAQTASKSQTPVFGANSSGTFISVSVTCKMALSHYYSQTLMKVIIRDVFFVVFRMQVQLGLENSQCSACFVLMCDKAENVRTSVLRSFARDMHINTKAKTNWYPYNICYAEYAYCWYKKYN